MHPSALGELKCLGKKEICIFWAGAKSCPTEKPFLKTLLSRNIWSTCKQGKGSETVGNKESWNRSWTAGNQQFATECICLINGLLFNLYSLILSFTKWKDGVLRPQQVWCLENGTWEGQLLHPLTSAAWSNVLLVPPLFTLCLKVVRKYSGGILGGGGI